MHKVTASAVILTALTGCGQSSGISNTQWSFKVPSEGAVSNPQFSLSQGNSSMVLARTDGNQAVQRAAVGRQMGPAFEQPEMNVLASAQLSAVGKPTAGKSGASKPGSQNSTGLSAEAYGLASDSITFQASTRRDPVAQVRAYLRASSPSALNNRTPYRSQVYLSSQPSTQAVAVPSYAPPLPVFENSSTDSTSAVVLAASLPGSISATDTSSYTGVPVFNSAPSDDASSYAVPGSNALPSTAYAPDMYSSTSETVRSSDGLPQLTPAVPSNYTASPSASQALVEVQPPEDFSIGTAILHDLERKAASAPEIVEARTSLPQQVSTLAIPAASVDVGEIDSVSAEAPQAYASRELANNKSATGEPTVSSLTQTMPDREISPLVASFRAGEGLSQPSQSEPLNEFPSPGENQSSTPALSRVLNTETDLRSSSSSSPLLEGFRSGGTAGGAAGGAANALESPSPSAIYVPIATDDPMDSSAALTQQAISALDTEESTSDFINKLAQQDAFSSVVGSAALSNAHSPQPIPVDSPVAAIASQKATEATAIPANAPTIAQRIPFTSDVLSSSSTNATLLDELKGVDFNAFDKISPADLAVKKAKARRAALTLAIQQTSQRRQRITWR